MRNWQDLAQRREYQKMWRGRRRLKSLPVERKCLICNSIVLDSKSWVLIEKAECCKSCYWSMQNRSFFVEALDLIISRKRKQSSQSDVAKVCGWSQVHQHRLEKRKLIWLTFDQSVLLKKRFSRLKFYSVILRSSRYKIIKACLPQ